MDIKQNSTMIIALAIAVVVVMSVMVPIISDTMDNAGSGGGGSEAKTYTNTGSVYLEELKDNSAYTIRITSDGSSVTITKDTTTLLTKTIGNEDWTVPIGIRDWVSEDEYQDQMKSLIVLSYKAESDVVDLNFLDYDISYIEDSEYGGSYANMNGGKYFEIVVNGTDITLTVYNSDNTVSDGFDSPMTAVISDSGEYVLAESPIVAKNTEIITYLLNPYPSIGVGAYKKFVSKASDPQSIQFIPTQVPMELEGMTVMDASLDNMAYTLDTAEYEVAYKLNRMTIDTEWSGSGYSQTYTNDITSFIVPVTVTVSEETGGDYRNDTGDLNTYYEKMEDSFIATVELDGGGPKVYFGDEGVPCYSGIPFAGKGFMMGFTTSSGTLYFQYGTGRYSNVQYEADEDTMYLYRQDIYNQTSDLLWRITSEGDYVLSRTDDGSADIYLTEDSEVYLTGFIGDGYDLYIIGTPKDNKVYVSEVNARSEEYTEIGSAVFNFDGYLLESVTLTDEGNEIEISFDDSEDGMLYGGIVPVSISTGSGGGGSGSLSPTLVTVLSIIPIMVLVGLVLMAVRSMKV